MIGHILPDIRTNTSPGTTSNARGLSPDVSQKNDVSDRQSILLGHYEHLNTVNGRTFEGCCVFDSNPAAKTYVLELDQETGDVLSFKILANSLKKS